MAQTHVSERSTRSWGILRRRKWEGSFALVPPSGSGTRLRTVTARVQIASLVSVGKYVNSGTKQAFFRTLASIHESPYAALTRVTVGAVVFLRAVYGQHSGGNNLNARKNTGDPVLLHGRSIHTHVL